MSRHKEPKYPPRNATAWCELHERLMNDVYIRRRGCVLRQCRHLRWLGKEAPMFTLSDYKAALKGAGPKLTENILARAREDPGIGFPEYVELADLAYPGDVL